MPAVTGSVLMCILTENRLTELKRCYSAQLAWQLNSFLHHRFCEGEYLAPRYDELFPTETPKKQSGKEIIDELERKLKLGNIN